ncbi:hypothetical protein Lbys_1831 [Leadbetterella byssophila DSM 17132]|jgi:hypothetical protein|uniref:Uncharacterized protein n=1 Tax=Leadbetterella byssophila (strain DSM 17132 / JCM 16389 / KACC 11308 / NBRC 106382 / 4M15) TaxID=649349 RepID=E4RQT1_LEAB4|nr:hypothetical protein [Leadbetterella byssophila]ADQ17537.1 hypothetical protein Lbys_1831 [Leadbetterella byssophila DSM 17132]
MSSLGFQELLGIKVVVGIKVLLFGAIVYGAIQLYKNLNKAK